MLDHSTFDPVEMQISVERESSTPIYRQIETQIRSLILKGRLPQGSYLPSERMLAHHLAVNRTTVVNAYRELAADGLVEGRVGEGTVVLGTESGQAEEEAPSTVPLSWTRLIRPEVRELRGSLVRRVEDLSMRPGVISLATGVPRTIPSPHLHLKDLFQQVLATSGQSLFRDSPAAGLAPLRAELGRRLAMRGCVKPSAERIFILSGSQQGLYLVAHLLLHPGDVVLVESPTYLGALEVFRAVGARLVEVPLDDEGMRMEAMARILSHIDVHLIYTIPNFQNPTGSTMSAGRRKALLTLAQRHQVPILEDDLYGELAYDGAPPAPLRAIDEEECVLYLSGLSSILGPGLRLGWLLVPSALVKPLTALRQAMDLHPDNFVQEIVHTLLTEGGFDAHLEWVRSTYARRREIMLGALGRYMPPGVRWNHPQGGFYIWCSLPQSLNSEELLDKAVDKGMIFVPGGVFFSDGRGECFMRLSFVSPSAGDIEEGVRRLAAAVKELGESTKKARSSLFGAGRPVV
ncbi:MAG: PLP-dependent aminotransferase family protein [Anaerolineales bacterium]